MIGRWLALVVVAYQRVVSPLTMQRCRFSPSCSTYAVTALREHGALRGGGLAVRRLLRCQPFSRGGYDPVPVATQREHVAPTLVQHGPQGVPR